MQSQKGMTLVETIVATAICGVIMVALGALAATSITQSKNQGQSVSQATALAAQKIDQLMTMQFSAATAAPLAAGGGLACDPPSPSPVTNFVEYLGPTGNIISGATSSTDAGVFFTRCWQITNSTATTKLIEVVVIGTGIATKTPPKANMACIKTKQ